VALNTVTKIDGPVEVRNVIVSTSDKSGLESFVPALIEACPEVKFYSTGGTFAALEKMLGDKASERLVRVSDYTGQPEMQGGLVKTLDFKVYLGLLSEKHNDAHEADLERTGAVRFDMVVVNLYPFRETVAARDVTPERARANIDIGGPCMIRAAAKNFIRVAAVTDPADYSKIAGECKQNGGKISLATRYELAAKAFRHTAAYDTAIAEYFGKTSFEDVEKTYPEIVVEG